MGGEQAISGCYVYEAAPKEQRSLLCSVVSADNILGTFSGAGVAFLLFKSFDSPSLLRWA